MISEKYKAKLLSVLRKAGGMNTTELRLLFPRAPLREMEKAKQIVYADPNWIAVSGNPTGL